MSASLLVDLGNTCQQSATIAPAVGVGSTPASGAIIGLPVDMLNADTYCNIQVAGGPGSGAFTVQVQTSPTALSGSFTDPTSGFPQGSLPTSFQSGGLFIVNSGLWRSGTYGGPVGPGVNNAPIFCSGGVMAAAFLNNNRYVRANILSGAVYGSPVTVNVIANLRTTGSGGGFTLSPTSGSVNV